jgi:hypothetical protein
MNNAGPEVHGKSLSLVSGAANHDQQQRDLYPCLLFGMPSRSLDRSDYYKGYAA